MSYPTEEEATIVREQIERLTDQERIDLLVAVVKEAINGVGEDGAHHKQYYLSEIIRLVLKERYREWLGLLAEHDYYHEQGSPP